MSLEGFVGRNFYNIFEYFSPQNLPLLFKLKALRHHYHNVGHYFDGPRLKSAFTFQDIYLGLSPYDAPASFEPIFEENTLPDKPSFYVHAPARYEPSAAPAGQDTLMVLVPVGHLTDQTEQDWEALRARARYTVLDRLAQDGITDLEKHIKFEVNYTPVDWMNLYNLKKGAAFGLGHNFTQVGYLRPHNRHVQYRNLSFVGSSTHPGAGVPMALLSSRLTTERILR